MRLVSSLKWIIYWLFKPIPMPLISIYVYILPACVRLFFFFILMRTDYNCCRFFGSFCPISSSNQNDIRSIVMNIYVWLNSWVDIIFILSFHCNARIAALMFLFFDLSSFFFCVLCHPFGRWCRYAYIFHQFRRFRVFLTFFFLVFWVGFSIDIEIVRMSYVIVAREQIIFV